MDRTQVIPTYKGSSPLLWILDKLLFTQTDALMKTCKKTWIFTVKTMHSFEIMLFAYGTKMLSM